MREILFRGKRNIDNRWIEGNFITDEQDSSTTYIGYLFGVDSDGTVHDTDITEVDPETVCQYTGLTDKNGRKIFEGDIVKINDDVKEAFGISDGSVVYRGGSFIIGDSSGNGTLNSLFAITDINYVLRGEVIGNIFDNPELIGE